MRLIGLILFTLLQSLCWGATFTVTTTDDTDDGKPFDAAKPQSLRKAMRLASEASGKDTIAFDIPAGGGLATIVLNSELPPIMDPMVINGYTQPGSKANSLLVGDNAVLKVEIDCRNTVATLSRGFYIRASDCEIRGLIINNCLEAGIIITRGFDTVIAGNWIGVQADGVTPSAGRKNKDGIWVSRSARNRIGGPNPADRNLISGNREVGLVIFGADATNNLVLGNYIGCDLTGGNSVPNQTGMFLFGSENTIGDGTPSGRNIFSGNLEYGIEVTSKNDPRPMGNVISGNFIGLGADGDTLVPNQYSGILLWDAEQNLIGGATAAEANVISGNTESGIFLYVSASDPATTSTSDNRIYRNLIGTDATGTKPRGNGTGILVGGGPVGQIKGNRIGAVLSGVRVGNVISGNQANGLQLTGACVTENRIEANFIGVDIAGTKPLKNVRGGILVGGADPAKGNATKNLIGGLDPSGLSGNIVSGNGASGIALTFEPTSSLASGGEQTIQGNFIGTDVTGKMELPNQQSGIHVTGGASKCLIGGTDPLARNVISGNKGDGIVIAGKKNEENRIVGNLIGTDVDGLKEIPNQMSGVHLGSESSTSTANRNAVGGSKAGERNVISGNTGAGVLIANGSSNTVQGNWIGVDISGKKSLGNRRYGVGINAVLATQLATTNLIGGTLAGAGNVISGNGQGGILIEGTNAIGNIVQGNFLGTDSTGSAKLGNLGCGIEILGAKQSIVGADSSTVPTDQHANRVAFNQTYGVKVSGDTASGNTIRGNRTHDNGGLAIVLGDNASSTPPDPLPPGTGPNGWAKPPSQLSVRYDAKNGMTSIGGRITGPNPDQVTVDLYAEPADSKKPFGDQSTYLTSTKPDKSGYFCAVTSGNVGGPGSTQQAVATTTSAFGSTSRFMVPRFKLVALEVTQVVQDWKNSVKLFAGKTTYVRAFLESVDGADHSVPWSELDSQLLLRKDGVELTLKPEFPVGMQILADASKGRKNRQGSINFRIPEAWCEGTLQLLLQTDGVLGILPGSHGSSADCLGCGLEVAFQRPPKLEITLVNVQYLLQDRTSGSWTRYYNDTDEITYNKLLLEHMMPVTRIDWKELNLDLGRIATGLAPDPEEPFEKVAKMAGPSTRSFLALVPGDPLRGRAGTVTIGLGSLIPPYVAASYYNVPFGSMRAIPAHELVHTLGFDHAFPRLGTPVLDSTGTPIPNKFLGPCGEDMGPPPPPLVAFPYGDALNHPVLGPFGAAVNREDMVFGFDTTPPVVTVIAPERVKELMCYCYHPTLSLWVSRLTYENVAKTLESRFGLASVDDRSKHRDHLRLRAQVPPQLVIRGTVNHLADTVDFTPFSLTYDPVSMPAGSGKYVLQLLDAGGNAVYTRSFDPEPSRAGTGPLRTGSFILETPTNPNHQRAQIIRDGAVLASRTRSPNTPVLSNLTPAGGESIQTQSLLIQWSCTDQDGDALSYDVQLSTDGGASWSTLATDWTETSFTTPTANLEGTRSAKVRVIASDGFNVTSLESPGVFTLPNQPPFLRIVSPRSNQSVSRSQSLALQAFASDLQDGRLSSTNVVWRSSLDGLLGFGAVLDLDTALLTAGLHQITATASNSLGQASTDTTTLAIDQSVSEASVDLGVSASITPMAPLSGGTASLAIAVANLGRFTANDVRLEVALPTTLPDPSSPVTNASITLSERRLAAELGQLLPGQSVTLTLIWTNLPAGNHRIESAVNASAPDVNADDNRTSSTLLVTPAVPDLPNLILSLSSTPENPGPGDTINYVVSIVNQGTAAATQVRLTNVLSEAASLASAGVSQGSWTTNGNLLVGQLGTLPVGGEGYLYFSVKPSGAGSLYYRISATADETDLEPLDNLTSKIVTVASQLRLGFSYEGGQIRLEWPNHPNLQLQQTSYLGLNAAWSAVPDSPVLQGDRWFYRAPLSGSTRFYRLQQP